MKVLHILCAFKWYFQCHDRHIVLADNMVTQTRPSPHQCSSIFQWSIDKGCNLVCGLSIVKAPGRGGGEEEVPPKSNKQISSQPSKSSSYHSYADKSSYIPKQQCPCADNKQCPCADNKQCPCADNKQCPCADNKQCPCADNKQCPCADNKQCPCADNKQCPCADNKQCPCADNKQCPCADNKQSPGADVINFLQVQISESLYQAS